MESIEQLILYGGIVAISAIVIGILYWLREPIIEWFKMLRESFRKPTMKYDDLTVWFFGLTIVISFLYMIINPNDIIGYMLIDGVGFLTPIIMSLYTEVQGYIWAKGKPPFQAEIGERESFSPEITNIKVYGNLLEGSPEVIEGKEIDLKLIEDDELLEIESQKKIKTNREISDKIYKWMKENNLVLWTQKFFEPIYKFMYKGQEIITDKLAFITDKSYDSLERLCWNKAKGTFVIRRIGIALKNILYGSFVLAGIVINEKGMPTPILVSGHTKETYAPQVQRILTLEKVGQEAWDGRVTDKLLTELKNKDMEIERKDDELIQTFAMKLDESTNKEIINVLGGSGNTTLKTVKVSKRMGLILLGILGFVVISMFFLPIIANIIAGG